MAPRSSKDPPESAPVVPGSVRGTHEDVALFFARSDEAKVVVRGHDVQGGSARGLVFALDATASRQPTWDMAAGLTASMFAAAASVGGLELRLMFYRGLGECRLGAWTSDPADMMRWMGSVRCAAGPTQLTRMLRRLCDETSKGRVRALVFVGDAFEEDPSPALAAAGELGVLGVPVFVFQEGFDPLATDVFRAVAMRSGGAWRRFDPGSADALRAMLCAVAAYASAGADGVRRLAHQTQERALADEALRLLEHVAPRGKEDKSQL